MNLLQPWRKGGSPPPAPDYPAAAKEQGSANLETALAQGRINNPNVIGPLGNQDVTWDGNTPTIRQTLSPQQQRILDQQQGTQLLVGDLAQRGVGAAQGIIGQSVNFNGAPGLSGTDFAAGAPGMRGTDFTSGASGLRSTDFSSQAPGLNSNDITNGVSQSPDGTLSGLPQLGNTDTNQVAQQFGNSQTNLGAIGLGNTDTNRGTERFRSSNLIAGSPNYRSTQFNQGANAVGSADQVRRQVIDAMMSRVNEDIGIRRGDVNSNMVAAGLRPGSTAYDAEQNLVNRAENDARQQAIIAGGNAAQQQFGMDMARRQQAVGENQDMFAATAAQRAQMTDEQRQMFDAASRNRAQQVGEQQQNFGNRFNARGQQVGEQQQNLANTMNIRGQQVGENQQNFANSALARSMGAQIAGQQFQQLMSQRQQGVNENQQMYQNAASARQQALDAAQNEFAASLGARQQGVNEQAQMFGASQAARQQSVSEAAQQFGASQAARQQSIQEMLAQRSVPLNEITALASGSQVSNPFSMPGYAQNTQVQPPPIYQARQDAANYNTDLYNARQAQQAQLQQGLFALGGTGLMAGGLVM